MASILSSAIDVISVLRSTITRNRALSRCHSCVSLERRLRKDMWLRVRRKDLYNKDLVEDIE
ncbi:hypothetical protein HUJ04_001090 [Dendroctonus ponderosae]|nr:hypothetical protein HUJ04_001090 [Dendroctonus ponderosae]